MKWPFKWKLSACTYTRCYLFFKILQNEIWKSGRNLPLATFGSERVHRNKLLKKESYCNFRLTVLWGAHKPGIINKLKLNTRNKALLFKTFWLSALRSVLTEAISAWTGLYYSWIPGLWIAWILRKVSLFCGTYQPRPHGFSLKKWEQPWGRGCGTYSCTARAPLYWSMYPPPPLPTGSLIHLCLKLRFFSLQFPVFNRNGL